MSDNKSIALTMEEVCSLAKKICNTCNRRTINCTE